jgi:hypothetical protein
MPYRPGTIAMIDLPANVTFGEHPDGWSLCQDEDAIRSVQAFLGGGGRLIVELWGTGPLLSPAGKRRDDVEFQQTTRIDLRDRSWQTERLYFNVVDDASHSVDQSVTFRMQGTEHDVARVRRF